MSSPPADNPPGDRDPAFGAADLTNCDREPIHIPAAIQPHGVLLTLDPLTLTIIQAGGDTARILGTSPDALPEQPMAAWFPPDCVARLRRLLATEGPIAAPVACLHPAGPAGRPANRRHRAPIRRPRRAGTGTDAGGQPDDALSLCRPCCCACSRPPTPQAFCQGLADEVRRITGFDRVMVYRFLPDDSGAVVAEARHAAAESLPRPALSGLRHPTAGAEPCTSATGSA